MASEPGISSEPIHAAGYLVCVLTDWASSMRVDRLGVVQQAREQQFERHHSVDTPTAQRFRIPLPSRQPAYVWHNRQFYTRALIDGSHVSAGAYGLSFAISAL